ncbi:non-ribosomal peptide synthetase [Nostoc sp. UIC 10890]
MKTIDELMSELRSKDVKLWSQGDRLRYKAPSETLTSTLLSELKERKTEILEFLHQANTAASSNLPTILPASQHSNLPLSFAQQRLWFLNQLEPDSTAYNMPTAYRLTGILNVTALKQSLNEIWQRHSILRATFVSMDGQPSQAILKDINLTLLFIDLQEIPEANRETQTQRFATQEAQQPFDLAKGPLFRAKLLRLATTEHVLLLTMHHIVNDGWSYNIFFRELVVLYTAFSTGEHLSLSEPSIQYTDFAVWQRQCLQGEVLESQLNYWKQQLGGKLPILQLPTNYSRPAVQTYRGAYQSLELSLDLTQALKTLSEQERVTLFMTLLAVFKVLLYRYSGLEDIIIGTPIAGRNREETEQLIGLFVNSLPLRTNLGQNLTFRELLSQVREVTLEAYSHQDFPLEKLIEELQPERDTSRSPLFQVMFVFQNTPSSSCELLGLTITPLEVHTGTAKFDLTLYLEETSEGICGGIEYNTDLFESTTITRMVGHFQTLLESIVANPQQHISNLPLLRAAEQHQLLVEWNNTQTDYPKDTCIHELFEEQVAKTPDAVAVIFENQQLTYQQLNYCANELAHYLISLGVKPEVKVGICVERSLDLIVGLLGILKAGGAYVPLDPAYPQERLAFMLQDSQISILLTQQHLLKTLPSYQAQVICLDRDRDCIAAHQQNSPESYIAPDNLIYTIYTSGSTGKPKGVQITHRNIVNFLTAIQQHLQLTNLDSLLSVTSLSFDIAGLEIFLPLTLGAKVILVSREVTADGLQLLKQLNNSAATVMQATPATWEMLLEAGWKGKAQLKILCGGEALTQNLATQLLQQGTEVWNLYGPTETTIWSTIHRIDQQQALVTIGRPIANTQIYILDKYLQPVPVGIPGELYIGGAGLARGYFHQPELTKEKFIQNPFSSDPESRLYKTGDLARYLGGGNIEFIGRLDNQVKIRGFRIELGEIEAVLSQHPAIQKTAVIVRDDVSDDKSIVAYIVSNKEEALTNDKLRRFLKHKLPGYMMPSFFVLLDTFPLTPNNKLDHHALPAPEQAKEAEDTFVAPQNELELQLTKIWEKNLGIQPISIRDNYFDLGGHSLLAVRLFAEIEKTFSKNLSLATLFQAPTVEQIASLLRQKEWSATLSGVTESSHAWESLVMIQSGSQTKPPLFCIHAVWGNVLFYRKLARYLDKEQPFYALQAQGVDGKQAPLTSIRKMASHYIREIQTIQPNGPYFLGGFSLGGLLAYEIAQQLHTQGQEVQLLAIFDTSAPSMTEFNSDSSETKLQAVWERSFLHFRRLLSLGFKDQVAYIWKKLHWHLMRGKVNFFYKFYLHYIKRSLLELRLLEVHKANHQARKSYTAEVYPGKLTLFRSDETFVQFGDDPELGWGQVATGGVEIYYVPGTIHTTIMEEPGVKVLAEKLQASLDNTQMNK